MLHLVTPLYHYDLLEKVYRTIPKHDDITWHISVSNRREKVPHDFVYTDPRIKLYVLDCADTDTVIKRNTIFNTITEGYFYLLDDDTVFMPALYNLYKQTVAEGFKGMVIGNQIHYRFKNNFKKAVYPTNNPDTTEIDSGMVLCYHNVLRKVSWEWHSHQRDFTFWSNCYRFFGDENTKTADVDISIYNALGMIKINKRFMSVPVKFNITNYRLARWYIGIRSLLRNLKIIKIGPSGL